MKWITCPGCDRLRLVHPSARACSGACRTRLWRRRRRGAINRRLEACAWCDAPLLYLPQDRLPAVRRYCDSRCARRAWLAARARQKMTRSKALEVAIGRLRRSRQPTVLAAALVLADLVEDMRQVGAASASDGAEVISPAA